jgi:Mg2+-importing ATPase
MYFGDYTTKTIEAIFSEFDSSTAGLREFVARERLNTYGPNKITGKQVTWRDILLRQFKSAFVYLLFFAALFSFFTDGVADGVIILSFIFLNAALGFSQEYNSEQALVTLKQFVKSTSRVRRKGMEMLIDTEDIVPGDVLVLSTGDLIPADVRFFKLGNVVINEEPLTGESAPVYKVVDSIAKPATSIQEAHNIGFAGTTMQQGSAEGIVLRTGIETFMGGVAHLTIETNRESGFEKGITHFSRFILRMVVVITVAVFLANLYLKGGDSLAETVLFAIALAISVVPEALPVVTTIALSKGALALAKNKVVVRRLSAIEDLGGIEVLCSDKTGTITENKLAVSGIHAIDEMRAIEYANLGSSFLGQKTRDPNNSFDLALWNKLTEDERMKLEAYHYISERPFDPELKTNSVLLSQDGKNILIVRGAPEVVLSIATNITEDKKKEALAWVSAEGDLGRRTIGVAIKVCDFDRAHCTDDERGMEFLGTISFSDNLKPTAKDAIAKAEVLGVQVKILTGDGPEVSRVVGTEVGIMKAGDTVITGDQFEAMSQEEKEKAVLAHNVFSRLNPKQKYEIIELLQKTYVVGFLGEGINDSPALKLANVALVVESAADIAREAADIVLLNQSLMVIMDGIEGGRRIFANIVKYLKITLASNFGNFYSVAIASLFIPYLPMLPIQILLLNLLSDFPMIAIATDNVDTSELAKPKSYESRDIVRMSVIFGLLSTVFDLVIFMLFHHRSPATLQTNWFVASVLTELVLIYSLRTKLPFWKTLRPGLTLSILSAAGVLLALILPFTPLGTGLFKFITPSMIDLRTIISVVALYFIATEAGKLLYVKIEAMRTEKKLQKI